MWVMAGFYELHIDALSFFSPLGVTASQLTSDRRMTKTDFSCSQRLKLPFSVLL
jgi:hypothetical protein